MHNIDRILNEAEYDHEYGYLHENEDEVYSNEQNYEYEDEWEGEWEGEGDYEADELSHEQYEQMEYELASELLAVTNEAELDQFFGKLIRRAGRGLAGFARSNVGRSLISGLKGVAKAGLPIAGKVVGGMFGGPVGGMIGSKLGTMASNLFEIQMEGMSNEDREFEVARRVVRLSTAATKRAVSTARRAPNAPPRAIATSAIKKAAAQHAPGLLLPVKPGGRPGITINPTTGRGKPLSTDGLGTTNLIGILGGLSGPAFYPNWGNPGYPSPPSTSGGGGGGTSIAPPAWESLPVSGNWERQGDQIIITL